MLAIPPPDVPVLPVTTPSVKESAPFWSIRIPPPSLPVSLPYRIVRFDIPSVIPAVRAGFT